MAFPKNRPPRASFPRPADGEKVEINPPGFCWWRAEGAQSYRFEIQNANGETVYQAEDLTDPVHVPDKTLPPGEYRWRVLAIGGSGGVIDTWGPRSFSIAEGAPEQPWIPAEELLKRAPSEHPRVIFLRSDLDRLRRSVENSREKPVEALISHAERCLSLEPPDEPTYDRIEDPAERRMAYVYAFRDFRRVIDNGMEPLALAYLFTGDRKYGEAALKILIHVARWNPDGVSSILAPYGDEIGLSLVKTEAHCYDWLHDLMDESERELVRRMLIARGNQMLRRLRDRRDFLAFPEESHAGRLPGYLCEHAIALAEEPEAMEWLDYALRAIYTVFPHWGGHDGGWAEGIGYGRAYNSILLPPFEAVKAALGINLWQRPFFRKVRRFFFYCTSPLGEIAPFGDGGTTGSPRGVAPLMIHHAQLFKDPACRWWAHVANPNARRSASLINLILPDEVEPYPPMNMQNDAVFKGVGWAALHSDIADPAKDTFVLFKSSPYGSISHSHADQNCFCILKGGKALATSSGYYGPAYGMPHHVKWTRQTKAHCGILVDGEGQISRSAEAGGRILSFNTASRFGYVCGDAAEAYGGRLTKFLRHVILIRPGLVCILDELEAPAPSTFQWLLHAFEPFELDEENQTVISKREGARMKVWLYTPGGFDFHQTNLFETPYNEGIPPKYHRDMPNHYHFTASTRRKSESRRIAAFMLVEGPCERFEGGPIDSKSGWAEVEIKFPGMIVRASSIVDPESLSSDEEDPNVILRIRWLLDEGREEIFEIKSLR